MIDARKNEFDRHVFARGHNFFFSNLYNLVHFGIFSKAFNEDYDMIEVDILYKINYTKTISRVQDKRIK